MYLIGHSDCENHWGVRAPAWGTYQPVLVSATDWRPVQVWPRLSPVGSWREEPAAPAAPPGINATENGCFSVGRQQFYIFYRKFEAESCIKEK